ncbi:MAG: sporulation integral membrane protein YtvI [Clostridia bacterium]|nr:sporulation integral membrane protein YtvI [Clostridia bacterium]
MRPIYLKVVTGIAVITVLYFLAKYVLPFFLPLIGTVLSFFTPFILAIILSLFLEPIIRFLHLRLGFSRTLSVVAAMLAVFSGVGAVLGFLVVRLIYELSHLINAIPAYQQDLGVLANQLVEQGKRYWQQGTDLEARYVPEELTEAIRGNLDTLYRAIGELASSTVNSLINFASLIPGGITTFITILLVSLLATFFISKDRPGLVKIWLRWVPAPYNHQLLDVLTQVFRAFAGYLKAQLILISISTGISILGLYLIGAKYALVMGLVIGIFDLIPVLGPSSVFVPWIIWAVLFGEGAFALKLTVLWLVIMGVRQLLESKVVADTLGLHPLATLMAMYIGLKSLGVLGMIMGPIVVIAFQAVVKAGVIKLKY